MKSAGLLLVSIFFIEVSLHVISALVPAVDALTRPQSALIDDDRLVLRGNPNWPEHDARGFRNPTALDQASFVAVGDSHTYGTSVAADEAWPSVVSRLLGKPVYNMGSPGFASSQAFESMPTATGLGPEEIVFALYFGNDFCDDFIFARNNKIISEYADQAGVDKIKSLEDQRTIEDEVAFLFGAGTGEARVGTLVTIKTFLKKNIRIFGLISTAYKTLKPESRSNALLRKDFSKAMENLSPKQLEYVSIYDGPDWKTIFTSRYRFVCLDDSDPRVKMGLKMSMQNIERMHQAAQEKGIRFYVLLVPTKEYVFYPRVSKPEEHNLLTQLIENETRIMGELEAYMQERGIVFIDPAPELRAAGRQPYFENGDGHPNATGHEIIAKKVFDVISAGHS